MQSPFIVKFIERVESINNIYIVTELCNGGDLENALD